MKDQNYFLYNFGIHNPVNRIRGQTKKQRLDEVNNMDRTEVEKFDVTKYVGTKSEIVVAEIKAGKYGEVIFIQTAPIDLQEGDTLPEGKVLSASIMLGLQKNDGVLSIGIDTKADKWLLSHGIKIEKDLPDSVAVGTELKALLGKKVVCQKNESGFLEIA